MGDDKQELYEMLEHEGYTPFNIDELTSNDILDKGIFEFLFGIEDIANREKLIFELEQKAETLKCLSNFKKILKSYEKGFKKSNTSTVIKEHNKMGDYLLENENLKKYENELCIYKDGVYKKDKIEIYKKIQDKVEEATERFRNEVYKYLIIKLENQKINRESGIINFQNGLLDTKTKELKEHTTDFFSINQIPVNINFNASKVQAIDDVLDKLSMNANNEVIPERRQTLLEMIGYCMTTSVKLQKAFILYGETASNGKSTLINLITALLGKENVSNVSFEDISEKQFAGYNIKGKLLNAGAEMTDTYIKDVSRLKEWITGDSMEVEQKYMPREPITPYAKFIFNANKLPRVADKTDGFYRRLQIIPLEHSFNKEEATKFQFKELTTKEALEYLAKIAVTAYMNMDKTFSNEAESQREVRKYKVEANNVLSFANDKEWITRYVNANTKNKFASEVYESYKNYCRENDFNKPFGKNNFFNEFEKTGLVAIHYFHNQKVYEINLDYFKNYPKY